MTIRAGLVAAFLLAGCGSDKPVITFDVDQCDFCLMTISDRAYAAAATDAGGRTARFDAIECLAGWVAAQDQPAREIWVTDAGPDTLIPAAAAAFHRDPGGSPMGSGWIASRRENAPAGSIGWDSLLTVVSAEGMPKPGLPPATRNAP